MWQMSSYGQVMVEGVELFSFRDSVDPTFMLLFRTDDLLVSRAEEGKPGPQVNSSEGLDVIYQFVVPAFVLRDRLAVLGIGSGSTAQGFGELVSDRRETLENWIMSQMFGEDHNQRLEEESRFLATLNLGSWQAQLRNQISANEGHNENIDKIGGLRWLMDFWDHADPRFVLRAIVDAFPDSEVVLDVTDLEEGGWFDIGVDPREAALEHFSSVIVNGSSPIVLAEGRTDIRILEQAMQVLAPHLQGFVRFADFTSTKAEGGASALVRTVKTLAAAGVANRIVALFDNDTAGEDALSVLRSSYLPANITVVRYPDLNLARDYPTLGPSGRTLMDINGLAGSIEIYLGEDVLRGSSGELTPVQWTGYVSRIGRYQGKLRNKFEVQDRFEKKAKVALLDHSLRSQQDWSGLQTIIDHIKEILDSPSARIS